MAFTLDASCFRAVVKNTFLHIEKVGEASDEKRVRRKSDASCVRCLIESPVLFGSEFPCSKTPIATLIAKEDAKLNMESNCLRASVKNTFVHVDSFESVPQSRKRLSDILHARDAEAQYYKLEKVESKMEETQALVKPAETPNMKHEDNHPPFEFGCFPSNNSSEDTDCSPSVGGANFTPEESVGSAEHYLGLCKPCVWFWRPTSCSKGGSCEYCHLCDEGAVARAVEVKKQLRRTKKRARAPSQ